MAELLDHAITVRDVLYLGIGFVVLILLLGCAGALYLTYTDRKRDALLREMRELHAMHNLRNPAYGMPSKPGIKWKDGKPYVSGDEAYTPPPIA